MPDTYLLDTCVLKKWDARVEAWIASLDDPQFCISVVSLMEGRKGIELLRAKKPEVAKEIEKELDELIAEYRDRIVGIDLVIADIWGRFLAKSPRHKRTDACMDAAVAASASGKYWLVTDNVKDFRGLGLNIVNPLRKSPQTYTN